MFTFWEYLRVCFIGIIVWLCVIAFGIIVTMIVRNSF